MNIRMSGKAELNYLTSLPDDLQTLIWKHVYAETLHEIEQFAMAVFSSRLQLPVIMQNGVPKLGPPSFMPHEMGVHGPSRPSSGVRPVHTETYYPRYHIGLLPHSHPESVVELRSCPCFGPYSAPGAG